MTDRTQNNNINSTNLNVNDENDDFWSTFLTFKIGGFPVIITLSIFLCIVCVTVNCSLWWYFSFIRHKNCKLTKENQQLIVQINQHQHIDQNDDDDIDQDEDEYYNDDQIEGSDDSQNEKEEEEEEEEEKEKDTDIKKDECTVNDLWKEIEKLKSIISWYDSALKKGDNNDNNNNNNDKNKIKLSNDISLMSLPERNMYIIEIGKNDKTIQRNKNYLNLMEKMASLNSVMQEEEKMIQPNYDNYEEFKCDICNNIKTKLDEILIFEECYHYYCINCLIYILKKRNEKKNKIKCPYNGCNHILSRYEINYIEKRIDIDINIDIDIINLLESNYYGSDELFETPFGIRPIIYCDWISTGKSLKCIEKYINKCVMKKSNDNNKKEEYLSECKSIILKSIGGDQDKDCIIFTGSGSTDAIYKMSSILFGHNEYNGNKTVIFVSIYERDSNIFIWKELGCKIIIIPEDKNNGIGIDLLILEKHLKIYNSSSMKLKYNLLIGSFCAISNVNGIILKNKEITLLLHKYNALSFIDYSNGGEYLDIDMSNIDGMTDIDAIFISTHRFIGGQQSMGILCAKKKLFKNYIPVQPQNNTLFYSYGFQDGQYQYFDNIENREQSGTLNIISCIRTALNFYIKDIINTKNIKSRHDYNLNYFIKQCSNIKNLKIIGYTRNKSTINRLPIISFEIKYKNKFLHYNFVLSLMNDLFGIKGYGGNGNCGIYCKYSLNLTDDEMLHMIKQMTHYKNELSRPGYFTLLLHYTLNQNKLKYITNAVKYICHNGWKFLPLYTIDIQTGLFYHRNNHKIPNYSLFNIYIDKERGEILSKHNHTLNNDNIHHTNLNDYFKFADNEILKNLKKILPTKKQIGQEKKVRDKHSWYWLPSEMFPYVVEYAFQDVINSGNKS